MHKAEQKDASFPSLFDEIFCDYLDSDHLTRRSVVLRLLISCPLLTQNYQKAWDIVGESQSIELTSPSHCRSHISSCPFVLPHSIVWPPALSIRYSSQVRLPLGTYGEQRSAHFSFAEKKTSLNHIPLGAQTFCRGENVFQKMLVIEICSSIFVRSWPPINSLLASYTAISVINDKREGSSLTALLQIAITVKGRNKIHLKKTHHIFVTEAVKNACRRR